MLIDLPNPRRPVRVGRSRLRPLGLTLFFAGALVLALAADDLPSMDEEAGGVLSAAFAGALPDVLH